MCLGKLYHNYKINIVELRDVVNFHVKRRIADTVNKLENEFLIKEKQKDQNDKNSADNDNLGFKIVDAKEQGLLKLAIENLKGNNSVDNVVKDLIKGGADANEVYSDKSVLYLAISHNLNQSTINLLRQHGAKTFNEIKINEQKKKN
jgi:hypothetical protein